MRYVFKMEAIGDGFAAYLRHYNKTNPPRFGKREIDAYRFGRKELQPWVARINGLHPKFEFECEFLKAQKDYLSASSTGNRGIWLYYALKPGIYEINQRYTWNRHERYFARVVDDNTMERMTKAEVIACFKNES